MADGTLQLQAADRPSHPTAAPRARRKLPWAELSASARGWQVLRWLGSLKITVTMFALGMLVLLVGTLAQDEENLQEVKRLYFNSWIAKVPLDVFLPVTMFPLGQFPHTNRLPGWFPMPGGATIGLILLINLIAAKTTRFSLSARGGRLAGGLLLAGLGAGLTALVLISAHLGDGLQGEPPFSYDLLWRICQATLVLSTFGLVGWLLAWPPKHRLLRATGWSHAVVLVLLSMLLLGAGDKLRLDDPALRIMWQLGKSLVVGGVLLAGLLLLFGKRGGNVLIHLAVGLLMLGQFIFGDRQIEEQMMLPEGTTSNVAFRTDEVELAIVDSRDPEFDQVTVIDGWKLERAAGGRPIDDPRLPFRIEVVQWMKNSDVQRLAAGASPEPATAGAGLGMQAIERPPAGGVTSELNLASAYLRFIDARNDQDLGTFLLSQRFGDLSYLTLQQGEDLPETIEVDGVAYQVSLRFRRTYKPYQLTLDKVQRINYGGTATPRDYSSFVKVRDLESDYTLESRIWMNNPLRYAGETFYQQNYWGPEATSRGVAVTGLQVVENAGWLIPYVSCILAGLGMLVHFGGTLTRFAGRYDRELAAESDSSANEKTGRRWLPPLLAVVLMAVAIGYQARPRKPAADGFDWATAGRLPMQHEGRIKPLSTVANLSLQTISEQTSLKLDSQAIADLARAQVAGPPGDTKPGRKISATEWLLAVMAEEDWVERVPLFRIVEPEVVAAFGLEPVPGHRYSYRQLQERNKLSELRQRLSRLQQEQANLSRVDGLLAKSLQRIGVFELIMYSYREPAMPAIGGGDPEQSFERFRQWYSDLDRLMQQINRDAPPGVIPPVEAAEQSEGQVAEAGITDTQWLALGPAWFATLQQRIVREEDSPASRKAELVSQFQAIKDGLQQRSADQFNQAVATFQTQSSEVPGVSRLAAKVPFEDRYNQLQPIGLSAVLYVLCGLLALASFGFWRQPLRRLSFWLLLAILILHTAGLAARIYILDRPPVINLYSSAVFIGWSVVLFGLLLELIFPIGIAVMMASVCGLLSLMVAYGLEVSTPGDTLNVLQAVLDTRFWLSTHVITVTLGYAATFFAGFFAIVSLGHKAIARWRPRANALPAKSAQFQRLQLTFDRIIYGMVCFALFFSFVGTVLGGLWADDSWGRFWGWDPKENGALMIVLWNALLLHARWDKLVGPRGFALLAIFGNVVTAWSWFGTNQLGIGLHSYGFNEKLLALLVGFCLSQLLLIGAGWLLTRSAGVPASDAPKGGRR